MKTDRYQRLASLMRDAVSGTRLGVAPWKVEMFNVPVQTIFNGDPEDLRWDRHRVFSGLPEDANIFPM